MTFYVYWHNAAAGQPPFASCAYFYHVMTLANHINNLMAKGRNIDVVMWVPCRSTPRCITMNGSGERTSTGRWIPRKARSSEEDEDEDVMVDEEPEAEEGTWVEEWDDDATKAFADYDVALPRWLDGASPPPSRADPRADPFPFPAQRATRSSRCARATRGAGRAWPTTPASPRSRPRCSGPRVSGSVPRAWSTGEPST